MASLMQDLDIRPGYKQVPFKIIVLYTYKANFLEDVFQVYRVLMLYF